MSSTLKTDILETTMVDVLQNHAQQRAQKVAMTFLGHDQQPSLTYGQLDTKAKAFAAWMQQHQLQNHRALLLLPPGLDFVVSFLGCLYAKVVAVPAYPPDINRLEHTLRRLQSIIKDAKISIVITTSDILSMTQHMISKFAMHQLNNLQWLATSEIEDSLYESWMMPDLNANSLAFLQYTSGSTGKPKGVMVSHGNLIANEIMLQKVSDCNAESVLVNWLPLYHDMGLIGGTLQPLYCGSTNYLMSPLDFLKKPTLWLETISKYHVSISGGPNFAYDLCTNKVTQKDMETLDLSCWRIAFSSSETIRHSTIERFCKKFSACGFQRKTFRPCYGLADATLVVSWATGEEPLTYSVDKNALEAGQANACSDENKVMLVGSGSPCWKTTVKIVNSKTFREVPHGRVGEIWVSGPQIAQGYWGQKEKTQEVFHNSLKDVEEETFLRTGDLGFIHAGEVFITGRIKDLMVFRGRNVYSHDVEYALSLGKKHCPEIRPGCSAAFSIEEKNKEKLIIFQEIVPERNPQFDAQKTVVVIRDIVLTYFGINAATVVLLKPGQLPKTSSGKLMRFACKKAFLSDFSEVIHSPIHVDNIQTNRANSHVKNKRALSKTDTIILQWFTERLSIEPNNIDMQQNFAFYGLESIDIVEFSSHLEENLNISIPETEFVHFQNIKELCDYVGANVK